MTDAIEALLERLRSGWSPKADEIDFAVPQHDLVDWWWFQPVPQWPLVMLVSNRPDADPCATETVIWIDRHLGWALCDDGFWWLYDAEEGRKMDFLGG